MTPPDRVPDRPRTDGEVPPGPSDVPDGSLGAGGSEKPPAGPEKPSAELAIDGLATYAGELRGKGVLTLHLSDAARARLTLDYRRDNRLVLAVDSTAGLRLSADDTLELSGGLTHDVLNRDLHGRVKARLSLSRDLTAELEQEFGSDGPDTSLSIKLRL